MDYPLRGCSRTVTNRLEIENDVLAGTANANDLLGLQSGRDFRRWRFERLGLRSQPDGLNHVAGNSLVQAARDGFNFGEFGHNKLSAVNYRQKLIRQAQS